MSDLPSPSPASGALGRTRDVLLVTVLTIYGLQAAQGFLIPLALAVLAFVLITAVSDRAYSQLGLPRWSANLLGVTAVLLALLGMGYIVIAQAASFARRIASYEEEVEKAVDRIVELLGPNAAQTVGSIVDQIDFQSIALWAVDGTRVFLGTFLLICLYVFFLMAERSLTTHKMLIAAGNKELGEEINTAMRSVSRSLQRYMSVKSGISAATSLLSYAIFKWIGIEFAETWAVITFALNFIPSIGSIIAVLFPAAFAALQYDTLGPFLIVLFGCGSLQFLIGNIFDPALMGRSLNISTFAVVLALTFWGTVWGVMGAFLSVPMTVCVLIIFSHIPMTRPLAVMLSQDGNLGDATPTKRPETL